MSRSELFDIPSDEDVKDLSTDDEVNAETEEGILKEELLKEMEEIKPKKVKKERKKMSDEAKEALLERLKKGRAKAKANRDARKKERLQEKSETLKSLKELREDLNHFKSKMNEKTVDESKLKIKDSEPIEKKVVEKKSIPTLPKIKNTFHGYNPRWWDK